MIFRESRTRYAAFILVIALLAALVVAYDRVRIEGSTRRVEIAMDYSDFLSLAQSYNYNPQAFLVELRRAGLTSLALSEELGGAISSSRQAYAISSVGLLDAARLAPLNDPTLAALVKRREVRSGEMYLLVYDKATYQRYLRQLPLHFGASGIRVLHSAAPYVIAVRTQPEYFNTVALGIPQDQLDLAARLHLLVIPRFQNDERLSAAQIGAMFNDIHAGRRISTVIFFGLRNQVLGFPDRIADTADLFRQRKLIFGSIETYDPSQVQKGNDTFAKLIPGQTVRVMAIGKPEQDKLKFQEIVARYDLGVNERNVRVIYLRPFQHEYNGLSIEKTNIELVRQIADHLTAKGFRLGRAAPIPLYRGNGRVLVGLCALAVPSIFVLLLGFFGWYRRSYALIAYVLTLAVYFGGIASHHDILARSIIALIGALLFAAAAFAALSKPFLQPPQLGLRKQLWVSLKWTLVATGIALLGALTVVGLMSAPLLMEEIERFRGVKLVEAVPPLIALLLYIFTDRFGGKLPNTKSAFAEPIRIYQLLLGIVVISAGALLLMRSGNQSDIAPSGLELSLRHGLASALSVRPRLKEFAVGFPPLMLMSALLGAHRRAVGWLLALGIGVGLGDIIDTFSHLHTPVLISLLRTFNGAVLGCVIGAVLILIYRMIARRIPT
ncbi:MAG: DUF5693 family protein [Candidatus Eremiobacteraeota bacterium]|nr:DUF5693 family protein [Candidatus Eremiobacteraeota bacterium]